MALKAALYVRKLGAFFASLGATPLIERTGLPEQTFAYLKEDGKKQGVDHPNPPFIIFLVPEFGPSVQNLQNRGWKGFGYANGKRG